MPDNIPVRISGFVKKNTAYRETICTEKRADQGADRRRPGKPRHCRNFQQIVDGVDVRSAPNTLTAADVPNSDDKGCH